MRQEIMTPLPFASQHNHQLLQCLVLPKEMHEIYVFYMSDHRQPEKFNSAEHQPQGTNAPGPNMKNHTLIIYNTLCNIIPLMKISTYACKRLNRAIFQLIWMCHVFMDLVYFLTFHSSGLCSNIVRNMKIQGEGDSTKLTRGITDQLFLGCLKIGI